MTMLKSSHPNDKDFKMPIPHQSRGGKLVVSFTKDSSPSKTYTMVIRVNDNQTRKIRLINLVPPRTGRTSLNTCNPMPSPREGHNEPAGV